MGILVIIRDYHELIVWQKAMELVTEIYRLTRAFPRDELYGLTSQIRRAAVSIPSNIAEGQARQSTAEFRNFLSISQGSRAEVETQLLIAVNLQYATQQEIQRAASLLTEIQKMLTALHTRLQ